MIKAAIFGLVSPLNKGLVQINHPEEGATISFNVYQESGAAVLHAEIWAGIVG